MTVSFKLGLGVRHIEKITTSIRCSSFSSPKYKQRETVESFQQQHQRHLPEFLLETNCQNNFFIFKKRPREIFCKSQINLI